MEKYSQYRDRGSGISPFLPISSPTSALYLPLHALLFTLKLPFFLTFFLLYFALLQFLPLGTLLRKASLWTLLGLPGIWWIDLQIDGVKKGSLAREKARLPSDGSVIASSFTSPIDALYLAAIFDPIFTISYPHTRLVQQTTLLTAILRALSPPSPTPPPNTPLLTLTQLLHQNPRRIIVVFPECTTTNGRGILPLSPSLLSAPEGTKIFPVNLRYSPPDITTPVPGMYGAFAWKLLSQQTHCIRVRIAEATHNDAPRAEAREAGGREVRGKERYLENLLEGMGEGGTPKKTAAGMQTADTDAEGPVTASEQKVLDRVGEALARLGRVKRVGLTVEDKASFVKAWQAGSK